MEELNTSDKTILISIPSYRDPSLVKSIRSALELANNPKRISFALGLSHYDSEIPDLNFIVDEFGSSYDMFQWLPDTRPGVTKVRASLFSNFYKDQDYFLTIDSHTEFIVKGWDHEMIVRSNDVIEKYGELTVLTNYNERNITGTTRPCGSGLEVSKKHGIIVANVVEYDTDITGPMIELKAALCSFLLFTKLQAKTYLFDDIAEFGWEETYWSYQFFMRGAKMIGYKEPLTYHDASEYEAYAWDGNLWGNRKHKSPALPDSIRLSGMYRDMILHNTGPLKTYGAIRQPREYWEWWGMEKWYDHILKHNPEQKGYLVIPPLEE